MSYEPPAVWIDKDGAYHRSGSCHSLQIRGVADQGPLPVMRYRYAACVGCVVGRSEDHAVGGGLGSLSAGACGTRR